MSCLNEVQVLRTEKATLAPDRDRLTVGSLMNLDIVICRWGYIFPGPEIHFM